ncbi:MAG TPA: replicative DNA helicase [Thermodesulfobacteriota bacterium]|nr:replicative DNA helicase [Thermodesulfobacteriota bacterium]
MAGSDGANLKIPPQNLEAEQSVLGGILLEPEALSRVLEVMTGDDFYRESHRKIFDSMLDLYQKGTPVDLITLTEILHNKGHLENIGGASYLTTLTDAIPSAVHVDVYAKIIREKSILRRLINRTTEIASKSYNFAGQAEDLLDEAEKAIFEISDAKINPLVYPLSDVIKDSFSTIEQLYDRREKVIGVPSGFTKLDQLTSGFQNSDLIIIAGRPSMGKTAFALNIARNAAVENEIPVVVFSLEMSRQQLAIRLLCSEARIDSNSVRTGYFGEREWSKLTAAAGVLSEAPIYIDDSPAMGVLQMRAKARRLRMEKGLGLIVIDYLQLMKGREGSERREQEISEISRSLKGLAKELNIPVIALSQLNRRPEGRDDKKPVLADLRESGAIEQDADVICFIFREEMYEENPKQKGIAEILLRKHRNGPTGTVALKFWNEYTRFDDLAGDMEEPYQ